MNLQQLHIDSRINPRAGLNAELIERYGAILDKLPPIVVHDKTWTLVDGFHRVEAAIGSGRTEFPHEEISIPETELFAEACRRNMLHGLPLNEIERNAAIVKQRRAGRSLRDIAQDFNVTHAQISYICGAADRTDRIRAKTDKCSPGEHLLPKHEQHICKIPEPLRDKLAEVVLTRHGEMLNTNETLYLALAVNDHVNTAEAVLDKMIVHREMRRYPDETFEEAVREYQENKQNTRPVKPDAPDARQNGGNRRKVTQDHKTAPSADPSFDDDFVKETIRLAMRHYKVSSEEALKRICLVWREANE